MTVLNETTIDRVKPSVSPISQGKKAMDSSDAKGFANIFEFASKTITFQKSKFNSMSMADSKQSNQSEVKNNDYSYNQQNEVSKNSYSPSEKSYINEHKEEESTKKNSSEKDKNEIDPSLYINTQSYVAPKQEIKTGEKPEQPVVYTKQPISTEKLGQTEIKEQNNKLKSVTVPKSEFKSEIKSKNIAEGVDVKGKPETTDKVAELESKLKHISTHTKNTDNATEAKKDVVDFKVENVNNKEQISNNKKVLAEVSEKHNILENKKNIEKLKNKPEINIDKDATVKVSENNDTLTQKVERPLETKKQEVSVKAPRSNEQTEDVKTMMARMQIQQVSKDTSSMGKNGTNSNNFAQKQPDFKLMATGEMQGVAKSDFAAQLKIEKTPLAQRSEQAKEILNQINDKLKAELKQDNKEITISLRPDKLGKVDIKLISENGVLTAKIDTENEHVKEIINKGIESLKQTLTEQGISVGKIVVQSSEQSPQNQNPSQQFNENAQAFEQSNLNNQNKSSQNSNETSEGTLMNNYQKDLGEIEADTSAQPQTLNHQGLVDYTI